MLAQADGLSEWMAVYTVSRDGSETEKTAEEKIASLCNNFLDWGTIYSITPSDSNLETKAIDGIAKTAKTTDEWLLVLVIAPSGSAAEAKALENLGGTPPSDLPPAPEKKMPERKSSSSGQV
ncbi:MAG: hypothetical protein PHW95_03305 [Patescibacteria group bacterium]|nr:hypothetical protein [Patescibacteria group bacterium]